MGRRDNKLDTVVQLFYYHEGVWKNVKYDPENGVVVADPSERLTHTDALKRFNSIPGSQFASNYRVFEMGEYFPDMQNREL